MKDSYLAFCGFRSDAAKKSCLIKELLERLIGGVQRDIEIVTSTPKSEREMEITFSKRYNCHITVDHDSGYMSNHQESNSDSSLENVNEALPHPHLVKPIYLSEDALLEKPEVNVKTTDVKKRDCEEIRAFNMDIMDECKSPDTVLSNSVVSQETSYSGFDNSDSDISIEIPLSKQITLDNVDSYISKNDFSCNNIDYTLDITDDSIIRSQRTDNQFEETENCSALNNITNVANVKNSEKKRKLTLIFSKKNKENLYRVKRKYQSTSPEKNTPEKSDLDNCCTPEKIVCLEQSPQQNCSENSKNTYYGDNSECSSIIDDKKSETLVHDFFRNDETSEALVLNSSKTPKKDLYLKNELNLEEIVPQHSTSDLNLDDNKIVDEIKEKECLAKSVQQNASPNATPRKIFENPMDPNVSPDLFDHDEVLQEVVPEVLPSNYIAEEKYIVRKDQRLLKRVQNSLKGVLPPHSVTVVHLSIDEMLNRIETNKEYFWTSDRKPDTDQNNESKLNCSNESNQVAESKSLLITGNKDCTDVKWPQILNERYHGLHHNCSKISEDLEELFTKYGQRYVGAETQSTCTVFETNFISPTKRKQTKQRWAVKSPGRRLSHLAKRRITFSSANLQGGASSSVFGSRARQILVDAKKLDLLNRRRSPRKSPRKSLRRTPRKTPSKSPRVKTRTPSSSAKKKLAMRFRELAGEIEKTVPSTSSEKSVIASKRALFQSPEHSKKPCLFQPSTSGLSAFENELKKPSTKRALFMSPSKSSPLKNSPFKRSPFKRLDLGMEKKRKRLDSDDAPPSKLARSMSVDVRPTESEVSTKFSRTMSEMNISLNRSQAGASGELSAVHKKKLQWAVYESLRSQNITPAHPQFKVFASVLARVTRRFLPNLTTGGPKECGTTERMLRIARIHVYAVLRGKSVEEIVSEHARSRAKNARPQGYVGLETVNDRRGLNISIGRENIVQPRFTTQESLDKKKLEILSKPKAGVENRIDRIRKVINFGDDNR